MTEEVFADGDSPLHRTAPVIRAALAIIYCTVVALLNEFYAILAALAFSTLMAGAAKLGPGRVLRHLSWALGFLLFLWLVLPWSISGSPLFGIGRLTISAEGVALCGRITLKSISILLAMMSLLATMRVASLGQALGKLGLPPRLVQLLLLAYRYLFVLEQEYHRLYRAARIRNFSPRTNIHTYRTFAYLAAMLLVRAVHRAQRVHQAMVCRGFNGSFHSLQVYRPTVWNPVVAVVGGLICLTLAVLEMTI